MPANCRELVILQNPHGFLIFQRENLDPANPNPEPHQMADAIPALEIGDRWTRGCLLWHVEAFFSKKETPSS